MSAVQPQFQYLEHDGAERADVVFSKLAMDYLAEVGEIDQPLPKHSQGNRSAPP